MAALLPLLRASTWTAVLPTRGAARMGLASLADRWDALAAGQKPVPPVQAYPRSTLWHSAAHLLGYALVTHFGSAAQLCDGPALPGPESGLVPPGTGGFFYDALLPRPVEDADLKRMQQLVEGYVKARLPFHVLSFASLQEAKDLFEGHEEKLRVLNKLAEGDAVTAYRVGNFVDLCRGPHVANSGVIKAISLLKSSSVEDVALGRKNMQRVYGIAFASKQEMDDWKARTLEAQQRDHRVIGTKQHLFAMHDSSPGSAFMLPHGMLVQNRLVAMLRDEYARRGYSEVGTPILYRTGLWAKSGHLEHYKSDMFFVKEGEKNEAAEFGLKPMNCPGHCELFALSSHSYRELPVRLADFSPLHRNELSGTLTGLTRLRRFHQDDAHIFCTLEQIQGEIASCLDFVKHVYEARFGFKPKYRLSTRPAKSTGSNEQWEKAEAALRAALSSMEWTLNEGDGAFYGPKIDLAIDDALGRPHQVGTIQLDFQMPQRFDLKYADRDGSYQQPVMIHRAVLGSLERFMAILLEHTNGKLPFWLAPRQVAVVPIVASDAALLDYARRVAAQLKPGAGGMGEAPAASGLSVEVDESNESVSKKIRNAQQAPFSVIVVVGASELSAGTVSVRSNDGKVNVTVPLSVLVEACEASRRVRANEVFPSGLVPSLAAA